MYALSYHDIEEIIVEHGFAVDHIIRYLRKAIGSYGKPSFINTDQSGASNAAIKQYNAEESTRIKIRQCKYLNNIVEQVHRLTRRITRLMLGCREFCCAQVTLAGIELLWMLR